MDAERTQAYGDQRYAEGYAQGKHDICLELSVELRRLRDCLASDVPGLSSDQLRAMDLGIARASSALNMAWARTLVITEEAKPCCSL